jgi:hypothetical protein
MAMVKSLLLLDSQMPLADSLRLTDVNRWAVSAGIPTECSGGYACQIGSTGSDVSPAMLHCSEPQSLGEAV